MKNVRLSPSMGRIITYAGLVIVSLPLYIFILWSYSNIKIPDDNMAVQLFTSLLPGFLNQITLASFISLLLSISGLIIGITGVTMHVQCHKTNTLLILMSGVLTFINFFKLI